MRPARSSIYRFYVRKLDQHECSGPQSGTDWEIDAKGIGEGNQGFIIVECRRYTKSRLNQEDLGALAYRITDTRAKGGIIVTPLGLQEGAEKIAQAENIVDVRLDPDSTPQKFAMQFLNKMMIGVSTSLLLTGGVTVRLGRACTGCGKEFTVKQNESVCPECSPRVLILGSKTE